MAEHASGTARRRWVFLLLGLAALGTGLTRHLQNNFCPVLPGQVYRSGQLGRADLERRIAQHHLRAVINLRGANPDEDWYQEETAAAADRGAHHYDLPIDSQFPPAAEVRAMVRTFDSCERPFLLHCKSGIDRSGLASAVCVLLEKDGTLARARAELGRGLLGFFSRAFYKRQCEFLGAYEAWLARQGYAHSDGRFRQWALDVYDDEAENAH
jgi:protein tyrosine phosphatase (PTP) superfamily phosphohydrolase (DUF442 family)